MKISIINILAEKKWKIPHHITFIGNIKSNEMKKLQHEPRVGVKPFQEVKLKKNYSTQESLDAQPLQAQSEMNNESNSGLNSPSCQDSREVRMFSYSKYKEKRRKAHCPWNLAWSILIPTFTCLPLQDQVTNFSQFH